MSARRYVIWRGRDGTPPWVLMLDGFRDDKAAMQARRWQETGGASVVEDWATCRRIGPARFRDVDSDQEFEQESQQGYTKRAWDRFLAEWEES